MQRGWVTPEVGPSSTRSRVPPYGQALATHRVARIVGRRRLDGLRQRFASWFDAEGIQRQSDKPMRRRPNGSRASPVAARALLSLVLLFHAGPACRKLVPPECSAGGKARSARDVAEETAKLVPPECSAGGKARSARDVAEETAKMIVERSKLLASSDGLEQWDTPRGTYWVVKGNFGDMAHVLGEQEAEIYGDGVRGVRAGDIVLDCGAHFGGFVRTALAHGASKVVAIDITPETLECLRRNFKDEVVAGKVVVYGNGVWDKEDVLSLRRGPSAWSDRVGGRGTDKVQLTTIDKIVDELGLSRVDFIKMDIEGAEWNALAGAKATLKKFRPRMALASYHKPNDAVTLSKLGRELLPGYAICQSGASLGWGYQTLFFQ
jgi:FkbM family methyltransferase